MNTVDTTLLAEWVEGIPTRQPLYADDLMVVGLMVVGLILAAIMADRKRYLSHLLKSFFLPRENSSEIIRTTNITYIRTGMYFITFASAGLLLTTYAADKQLLFANNGTLWLVASGAVALFHILRTLLFVVTDRIFLDKATQASWENSYANWTILSGIPLYLATVITIFFDLSSAAVLLTLGACILLQEICLLYKAFHIFSSKKHGILQLLLYLCTLELIPLLVAGKALVLFV